MNILQRWLSRALPGPPLTWEYFMGDAPSSAAGVSVNENTALNLSPVWSGVFQLSGDVAKLPLNHNRQLPSGGKQVFDGTLQYILHDKPNPEMTSFKFRETMQALCILYGNAYAEIVRDALGRVAGMYPIAPSRVAPIREQGSGRLVYRVSQPSGAQAFIRPENMIHLSSLSTDGVVGHSITEHAKESIGLGLAAEKFGATFFGNGATFGGVVEVPMTLQGTQGELVKTNIRTAIEAVHAGVERAHKILVLAGGTTFKQRGTAPNEAQFKETRQFQIQEVSRWLVMPPHKLGDLENAHFTNIEESEIQYWKGTVHRWLKMWEQELKSKLIPMLERNIQSIDFNMEGELRGTSTQRAAFYKEMVGLGAYTINIVLEKEGLPTIGAAGDMHLVPLNMMPVEKYGEYIDATIAKLTAPPPQPQLPPKGDDDANNERFFKAVEETHTATLQLVERVTAKLEQEMRDVTVAAETARIGQTAAEAAAEMADAAKREAEQAAQAAADREAAALVELTDAHARLATLQSEKELVETTAAEAARASQAAADAVAAAADAALLEAHSAQDREAAALVELTDAKARLATLQSENDTAAADVAEKQRQIDAALADVDTKAAALTQAEAMALEQTTAAQEAATKAVEAEALAMAKSADVERLTAELEAARVAHAEQEQRANEAAAAQAAQQAAERERLSRVVTAHRKLILDAVQRVARTEASRARKHSMSPDKLRRWSEAFHGDDGRNICADMILPAVEAHLALIASPDDPRHVARAMADEYYEQSAQEIRTISAGLDGEEFQSAVMRMLARWETERPEAVADKVVRDEIAALVNR